MVPSKSPWWWPGVPQEHRNGSWRGQTKRRIKSTHNTNQNLPGPAPVLGRQLPVKQKFSAQSKKSSQETKIYRENIRYGAAPGNAVLDVCNAHCSFAIL